MELKNRYLFRGRISERKFRDLLRVFALDITADRAAELVGVNPKRPPLCFGCYACAWSIWPAPAAPFMAWLRWAKVTSAPPVFAANGGAGRVAKPLPLASLNAAGACIARS